MMMDPCSTTEDDNLTSLADLSESNLLQCIRKRYTTSSIIYTHIGDILVAVNPFRELPIYNDGWSAAYSQNCTGKLAPHIFGTASKAYNAMVQSKKNQVCVISGESGAGKTESTKLIVHQLMKMSRSTQFGSKLQDRIIQLNPLLEAFGNAKTLLNDNSSRFGKYLQLLFTPRGRIVGAGLEQYLLEKSRVCNPAENECNYHIFYYLFAGLSTVSPKLSEKLQLKEPSWHRYMSACQPSVNNLDKNRHRFEHMVMSMKSIGFTDVEIDEILTLLAAILHIGNIDFTADKNDNTIIKNTDVSQLVTELLSLESADDLSFALTTLRTVTRGETFDIKYPEAKATSVRDAMSKALYSRLFHWLVARINNYLSPPDAQDCLSIGILDIFGFENFQSNSFEQFCINLANEQLQQYFNTQIFAMEKEEYIKEGLDGVEISYKDNQPILQLFLAQPIGLISLLDEQCRTATGSASILVQRYKDSFSKHVAYQPNRGNALTFTVKHYAGNVEYQCEGFIDKNKDNLPDPVQGLMKFSKMRLVKMLFTKYPNFSGNQLQATIKIKPSQRTVMRKMSVRVKKGTIAKGRRNKFTTVSGHFRISLSQLMEKLFSSSPHFVRCIKPNTLKMPHNFEDEFVLKQLRYTGMLEAVRVRKEGFSYRPFFSDFVKDYGCLVFEYTDKSVKLNRENCEKILSKADITGWRIGKSRVFLRYFHELKLNSYLQELEEQSVLIQKVFRGYICRKKFGPLRELQKQQKLEIKSTLEMIKLRSDEIFSRIVELNRIDVLSAVERFGPPSKPDRLSDSDDDDAKGKKKFKPKAIGAVQVLVNVSSSNDTVRSHIANNGLAIKKNNNSNTTPDDANTNNKPQLIGTVNNLSRNSPEPTVTTKNIPKKAPRVAPKPPRSKPVPKPRMILKERQPSVDDDGYTFMNPAVLPTSRSLASSPTNGSINGTSNSTTISIHSSTDSTRSSMQSTNGSTDSTRSSMKSTNSSTDSTRSSMKSTNGSTDSTRSSVHSTIDNIYDNIDCLSDDDDYVHPLPNEKASNSTINFKANVVHSLAPPTNGMHTPLPHRQPKGTNRTIDKKTIQLINSSELDLHAPLVHRMSQLPSPLIEKNSKLQNKQKHLNQQTTTIKSNDSLTHISGYLPGISDDDAMSMISGESRGVYVIYTGYSRLGNFIFKLAVSRGPPCNGVWLCDIYNRKGLYLASNPLSEKFNDLGGLVNYYIFHDVNNEGLKLSLPYVSHDVITAEKKLTNNACGIQITKRKPVPLPGGVS